MSDYIKMLNAKAAAKTAERFGTPVVTTSYNEQLLAREPIYVHKGVAVYNENDANGTRIEIIRIAKALGLKKAEVVMDASGVFIGETLVSPSIAGVLVTPGDAPEYEVKDLVMRGVLMSLMTEKELMLPVIKGAIVDVLGMAKLTDDMGKRLTYAAHEVMFCVKDERCLVHIDGVVLYRINTATYNVTEEVSGRWIIQENINNDKMKYLVDRLHGLLHQVGIM